MINFFRKLLGMTGQISQPIHPELLRLQRGKSPPQNLAEVIAQSSSSLVEERRNSAYALGDYDDPIVIEILLELIHDHDLYVQTYAIQSLGRRHAVEAALPLCKILSQQKHHSPVSSNALRVLAELKDPRSLETLFACLKSEDPFLRFDATFALGEIGHRSAIPHLKMLVEDGTMPESSDVEGGQATAWSVGENARKAIAKILKPEPK